MELDASNIIQLATDIVALASKNNVSITTIESCTGGLIAAALTAVSGSSDIFEGGLVTYANEAKIHYAHVENATIQKYGVVSTQVAGEMACGGLKSLQEYSQRSQHIALSVTGIAGPSGGSKYKPVGTVCFGVACSWNEGPISERCHFSGDRNAVRRSSVEHGLHMVLNMLSHNNAVS